MAQRTAKLEEIRAIDIMLRQLQKELGESQSQEVDNSAVLGNGVLLPPITPENAPHRNLRPDEFYGMSQTEAAKAYLRTVGRAVSMDRLVEALKEGGAQLGGANPRKTLYVSLARNPQREFVSPKEGFIGLREFYKTLPKADRKPPTRRQHVRSSQRRARRVAETPTRPSANPINARVKERIRSFLTGKNAQSLDDITKDAAAHIGQEIKRSVIWGILRSKDFVAEGGKYRMAG